MNANTVERLPLAKRISRYDEPKPAVWIRTCIPLAWRDAFEMIACEVLGIGTSAKGVEIAEIRYRWDTSAYIEIVPLSDVARNAERAAKILSAKFSDLLTRPPSVTLAGMRDIRPETPSFLTPSLSGGETVKTEVVAE